MNPIIKEILIILRQCTERSNAIIFNELVTQVNATIPKASRAQITDGVIQSRLNGYPIVSLPNVGFFYTNDPIERDHCKRWITNWRKATGKIPITSHVIQKI